MMNQPGDRTRGVEIVVAFVSILGLIFLALLAYLLTDVVGYRASDQTASKTGRLVLWLASFGWPFALGLLTFWWPRTLPRKRWIWLVCTLGMPAPIIVLDGFGVFFAALMLVYPWGLFMTRGQR